MTSLRAFLKDGDLPSFLGGFEYEEIRLSDDSDSAPFEILQSVQIVLREHDQNLWKERENPLALAKSLKTFLSRQADKTVWPIMKFLHRVLKTIVKFCASHGMETVSMIYSILGQTFARAVGYRGPLIRLFLKRSAQTLTLVAVLYTLDNVKNALPGHKPMTIPQALGNLSSTIPVLDILNVPILPELIEGVSHADPVVNFAAEIQYWAGSMFENSTYKSDIKNLADFFSTLSKNVREDVFQILAGYDITAGECLYNSENPPTEDEKRLYFNDTYIKVYQNLTPEAYIKIQTLITEAGVKNCLENRDALQRKIGNHENGKLVQSVRSLSNVESYAMSVPLNFAEDFVNGLVSTQKDMNANVRSDVARTQYRVSQGFFDVAKSFVAVITNTKVQESVRSRLEENTNDTYLSALSDSIKDFRVNAQNTTDPDSWGNWAQGHICNGLAEGVSIGLHGLTLASDVSPLVKPVLQCAATTSPVYVDTACNIAGDKLRQVYTEDPLARKEANQIVADAATDSLLSDTNTIFWTKVGSRMAAEVIDKNYTTIATVNDFYNKLYLEDRGLVIRAIKSVMLDISMEQTSNSTLDVDSLTIILSEEIPMSASNMVIGLSATVLACTSIQRSIKIAKLLYKLVPNDTYECRRKIKSSTNSTLQLDILGIIQMMYGIISEDPSFFTLYSMNITNVNDLPPCIAKIGNLLLRLPNIISIVEGGDLEGISKDIKVSPADFKCTNESTKYGRSVSRNILGKIEEIFLPPQTSGSDFRVVNASKENGNFPSKSEIENIIKVSARYFYVLQINERPLLQTFTKKGETFILCAYKTKNNDVVCRIRDDYDNISFWEFDEHDTTTQKEMKVMPSSPRVTEALYVKEMRIDSILTARGPLFEKAIDKIKFKMENHNQVPGEYKIIKHSKKSRHALDHNQCLVTAFILAKYCGDPNGVADVYNKIPKLRRITAQKLGFQPPKIGNDAYLSSDGQYASFLQRQAPYKIFEAIADIESCHITLFTAMIPTFEKIEPIKTFGKKITPTIYLGYIPPSPPYWISSHFIPYVKCNTENINFRDADAATQGNDLKRIFSQVQPSSIEKIDNFVSTNFAKISHFFTMFTR